ncbi:hypothetical protein HDU97_009637 [Phlyctochytrium planicorne]|nr:hypothetical protein HDU97_009637 [Phlyctochytrium planicorne]
MGVIINFIAIGAAAAASWVSSVDAAAASPFDVTCNAQTAAVFQNWDLVNVGDFVFNGNVVGVPDQTACECAVRCTRTPGCALFSYGNREMYNGKRNPYYQSCFMKKPIDGTAGTGVYTIFRSDFSKRVEGRFVPKGGRFDYLGAFTNDLKNCLARCSDNPDCHFVTVDGNSCQFQKGTGLTNVEMGFAVAPGSSSTLPEQPPQNPSNPPTPSNPTTPQNPAPGDPSAPSPSASADASASTTSFPGGAQQTITSSETATSGAPGKPAGQATDGPAPGKPSPSNGSDPSTQGNDRTGSNSNGGSVESPSGSNNNAISIGLGVGAAVLASIVIGFFIVFCVRRQKGRQQAIREWSKKHGKPRSLASSASTEDLMGAAAVIEAGGAGEKSDKKSKEEFPMKPIAAPAKGMAISPIPKLVATATPATTIKYTKPFTREQYLSAGWTEEQLRTVNPPILAPALAAQQRPISVASDNTGLFVFILLHCTKMSSAMPLLGIIAAIAAIVRADSVTTCSATTSITFQDWELVNVGDLQVFSNEVGLRVPPCECASLCMGKGGDCVMFSYGKPESALYKDKCFLKGPIAGSINDGYQTIFKAKPNTVYQGSFSKPSRTLLPIFNNRDACWNSCTATNSCNYITIAKDGTCRMESGDPGGSVGQTNMGFVQIASVTSVTSDPDVSSAGTPTNDPSTSSTTVTDTISSASTTLLPSTNFTQLPSQTDLTSSFPLSTSPPEPSHSTNPAPDTEPDTKTRTIGLVVTTVVVALIVITYLAVSCTRRQRQRQEAIRAWRKRMSEAGAGANGAVVVGRVATKSERYRETRASQALSGVVAVGSKAKEQEREVQKLEEGIEGKGKMVEVTYHDAKVQQVAALASLNVEKPKHHDTKPPEDVAMTRVKTSGRPKSSSVSSETTVANTTASTPKYTKAFTREQYLSAGWTVEQLDTVKPPILIKPRTKSNSSARSGPTDMERSETNL